MYEKLRYLVLGAAIVLMIFLVAALASQIVDRASAKNYRQGTAVGANGRSMVPADEPVTHEPADVDEPMSLDEALEAVGVVEFNYDPGEEFSQLEGYVLHDGEPIAFTIICEEPPEGYAQIATISTELCIHLDGWDVSMNRRVDGLSSKYYEAVDDEWLMAETDQLYCLWYLAQGGEIYYVYDSELDEYVPAPNLDYIEAPYGWEPTKNTPTKRSLDASGLF